MPDTTESREPQTTLWLTSGARVDVSQDYIHVIGRLKLEAEEGLIAYERPEGFGLPGGTITVNPANVEAVVPYGR